MAEVGVRSTPARLNISMPRGQLRIRNETPQLSIDSQAPSFRVNRQKISNESGLKSSNELAKDFRNAGRQAALSAARQAKDDGNFIANHRIPGDKAIPALAKNKAMSRLSANRNLNIGLMPASSPEFTWDKGHMNVNWSKHSIVIDWDGDNIPQMTVNPRHSVQTFLRTEPYFRIRVEEVLNPNRPGRYVDRAV